MWSPSYVLGQLIHVPGWSRQVRTSARRAGWPGYPGSMYTLAKAVTLATTVAVALVVAGILIHLLGANPSNGIVSAVSDAAKWLAQPFDNAFRIHNAKTNVAVNWGIAAAVYALVGGRIGTALVRSAVVTSAQHPWRRPVV
jgi:hypothetical protein